VLTSFRQSPFERSVQSVAHLHGTKRPNAIFPHSAYPRGASGFDPSNAFLRPPEPLRWRPLIALLAQIDRSL